MSDYNSGITFTAFISHETIQGVLLLDPDPDHPEEFVNYNSFVAHLYELRIFKMDPSYSIWALRSALENDLTSRDKEIRSAFVLGAAQWIL